MQALESCPLHVDQNIKRAAGNARLHIAEKWWTLSLAPAARHHGRRARHLPW